MEHTQGKICYHDPGSIELHPVGDEDVGEKTLAVLEQTGYYTSEIALANAVHLVECWNYHQDLIDACHNLLRGEVDKESVWRLLDEIERNRLN